MPTIKDARALAVLGDSITADHISPAGAIQSDSPAGEYLGENGIPGRLQLLRFAPGDHEVMMRGTFANIGLRNAMAPGTEGGWTCLQPSGEQMTIFAAAQYYAESDTPLVVIGGKEYGTGSSRDLGGQRRCAIGCQGRSGRKL